MNEKVIVGLREGQGIIDLTDRIRSSVALIKKVDYSYLKATFSTLLNYMLDLRTDKLNTEPYNSMEKMMVDRWRDVCRDCVSHGIYLSANNKEGKLVTCKLERTIEDYANDIIISKDWNGEKYKEINLFLDKICCCPRKEYLNECVY